MYLKTFSRWTVLIGTFIIWTVKFLLRPYMHIAPEWKIISGIAPNFIGSFLLPFGACWFFQRFFRLQNLQDLRITCWFGLILVVINEYLQLIPVFGRTFDYFDILSSFVGVYFGYVAFAKVMVRYVPEAELD